MKKQSLLAVFLGLIVTCSPAVSSAQSFFYEQGDAPQQSCYQFEQVVRIGGVIHRQYGTRCDPVSGYAPVFYNGYGQQFYQSPRFVRQNDHEYRENRRGYGYAFPSFVDVRVNEHAHREEYCPTRDGRGHGGGYGRGYGYGDGYYR